MSDWLQSEITTYKTLISEKLGDVSIDIYNAFVSGENYDKEKEKAELLSRVDLALNNSTSNLNNAQKMQLIDDVLNEMNLKNTMAVDIDSTVYNNMA